MKDRPGVERLRRMETEARPRASVVQEVVALDPSMMTWEEFKEAEQVIRKGRDAFVAVGQALAAIRDGRGYRHRGFATFEEYIRKVWGWGRSHGYNMIWAAEVAVNVQEIGHPTLTQAIELSRLEPEQQRALVQDVNLSMISTRELQQEIRMRKATQEPKKTWPAPVLRDVSVYEGDPEALSSLLHYFLPEPGRLLDVTHNEGRMWRGLPYVPHRNDWDPWYQRAGLTDSTYDFRKLPRDWTDSWDGIVFDPPYQTDSSDSQLSESWRASYGLGGEGPKGDSIASLFLPFLVEAHRCLASGGIVVAKISNQVHSNRYQDQARMFKNTAENVGFEHCFDAITVSENRGQLNDPKWKNAFHPRTIHTYWLVLRRKP